MVSWYNIGLIDYRTWCKILSTKSIVTFLPKKSIPSQHLFQVCTSFSWKTWFKGTNSGESATAETRNKWERRSKALMTLQYVICIWASCKRGNWGRVLYFHGWHICLAKTCHLPMGQIVVFSLPFQDNLGYLQRQLPCRCPNSLLQNHWQKFDKCAYQYSTYLNERRVNEHYSREDAQSTWRTQLLWWD